MRQRQGADGEVVDELADDVLARVADVPEHRIVVVTRRTDGAVQRGATALAPDLLHHDEEAVRHRGVRTCVLELPRQHGHAGDPERSGLGDLLPEFPHDGGEATHLGELLAADRLVDEMVDVLHFTVAARDLVRPFAELQAPLAGDGEVPGIDEDDEHRTVGHRAVRVPAHGLQVELSVVEADHGDDVEVVAWIIADDAEEPDDFQAAALAPVAELLRLFEELQAVLLQHGVQGAEPRGRVLDDPLLHVGVLVETFDERGVFALVGVERRYFAAEEPDGRPRVPVLGHGLLRA